MKKKHSDHKNMTITNVSYNLAAQLNENSFLIQKINGFEYRYLTTILSFNIFKMISILYMDNRKVIARREDHINHERIIFHNA